MDVLVAYDIGTISKEGERRLAKVAAICERYGERVQYSLFECRVSPANLEIFKGELLDVIEPSKDTVFIYHFDGSIASVRITLGRKAIERPGGPWIISSPPNH